RPLCRRGVVDQLAADLQGPAAAGQSALAAQVPEAGVGGASSYQWQCTLHRPSHSTTSSTRASSVAGTSMPSAFAVLRLRIVWYLVGACTGRSAGFSPLRMRST